MMKFVKTIAFLIALGILTGSAQAAVVRCIGAKCGGTGLPPGSPLPLPFTSAPWDYLYEVTVNFGDHLNVFQVGTDDGNLANYTGFIHSSNWMFLVSGLGGNLVLSPVLLESDHSPPPTAHGNIVGSLPAPGIPGQGSGPDGTCPYVIQWVCPSTSSASATFYFGFNNVNPPHDAGGTVADLTLSVITWDEDWQQPSGAGLGPLHSPVPEPATLALLAAGALGAAVLRRRRR